MLDCQKLRIRRKFIRSWNRDLEWLGRVGYNLITIGPGFKNDEFTKIPTLKGKILNEWEILRINLAERSYKPPQGKLYSLA